MSYRPAFPRLAACSTLVLLGMLFAAFPRDLLGEQPECAIDELEARFAKGGGLGVGTTPAKPGEYEVPIFLKVRAVEAGGPAAQAGLRVGDGIYAVNGARVEPTEAGAELFGTLHRDLEVGDTVIYTVLRNDSRLEIEMAATRRTPAVVRYFVHTHLAFQGCEEYREYGRRIAGLTVLQG